MDIKSKYRELSNDIIQLNCKFREKSRTRMAKYKKKDNLNRPVASWLKEDRLFSGEGYEFTIIFRTKACSWAGSDSGGCSMCGYFNDKGPDNITQEEILNQFTSALEKPQNIEKFTEIKEKGCKICIKLFTSGSFLDDDEISSETRKQIFEIIAKLDYIEEIVVESRPEYVDEVKLSAIKSIIKEKRLIIGIGLESSNTFVREVLINKGFSLEDVKNAIIRAHKADCLVKIYLLLKPPFLSEKIAIRDAIKSIQTSIKIGADAISLNPVNIQTFTIAEHLFNKKKFRSPWLYTLFKVLKESLNEDILKHVLFLCDPSAAGKEKGVHNCDSKDCNSFWLDKLHRFIISQDYNILEDISDLYNNCGCYKQYLLYLDMDSA